MCDLGIKHRLNRDLNKPPIYFNAGTRKGQILYARLRLECSSLNSHLYRKKLVSEPTCQCGAFESSYQYLFVCPRYANVRERYLPENLNNYTTRDLLQGVQTNTVQENKTLLENVQKFIIKNWEASQMKRCNTILQADMLPKRSMRWT